MKTMKAKKLSAMFLAVLIPFTLAACGGGGTATQDGSSSPGTQTSNTNSATSEVIQQAAEAGANAVMDDVVVTDSYIYDEISMVGSNPNATLYPWGINISNNPLFEIYEKLFDFESYGGDLKPVMADASKGEFGGYDEAYNEETGNWEYTVYIYDYIYDSAGHHITANDVKFSYDKQVELEAPGQEPWRSLVEVKVVDDYAAAFCFNRQLTYLDDFTNFWSNCFVISEEAFKDSLGNSTDEKSAFVSDACGTGPYVLTNYVNGSVTTVEARDDYWQEDDSLKIQSQFANVKKINFVAMSETAQQVLAVKTGELDIVTDCPATELGEFFGDGKSGYGLYTWYQSGQRFFAPNCSEESIMRDINMRLAVFYAVDVNGLAMALGGDSQAFPCYTLMGARVQEYDPEWETWENYQTVTNQELVDQYLEAAGYNGETLVYVASRKDNNAVQIVHNMLTAAGINVELRVLDDSSLTNTLGQPGEWDLYTNRNNAWLGAIALSKTWVANRNYGGAAPNYVKDQDWFDMLDVILTPEGHTKENIDAYLQYSIDNAYAMGLYSQVQNIVYQDDIISLLRNGKNCLLPGGFIYKAPDA